MRQQKKKRRWKEKGISKGIGHYVEQQSTKLKIDIKFVMRPLFKFGLNLEMIWEIT
jgi:hypothetical protein